MHWLIGESGNEPGSCGTIFLIFLDSLWTKWSENHANLILLVVDSSRHRNTSCSSCRLLLQQGAVQCPATF